MWSQEDNLNSVSFYRENYEEFIYEFVQKSTYYFRDTDPRKCRFCGNNGPFEKKAHAVPEAMGNKSLVSYNECDICNEERFSKLEDNLVKYIQLSLIISAVRGKHGISTIKNDYFRFGKKKHSQDLALVFPQGSLDVDVENKNVKLNYPIESQKYTPLLAAKAFCKSILSSLHIDDYNKCALTTSWILSDNNSPIDDSAVSDIRITSFPIFRTFVPGPNIFGSGRLRILRRKSNIDAPYIWGIFEYGCFRYQVMLPFCSEDSWLLSGKPNTMHCYPYFLEIDEHYQNKYGNPVFFVDNLASIERKSDICNSLNFSFANIYPANEKMPIENNQIFQLPLYQYKAELSFEFEDKAPMTCTDFFGTYRHSPNAYLSYSSLTSPITFDIELISNENTKINFSINQDIWIRNDNELNNLPGYDIIENILMANNVTCNTYIQGYPTLSFPIENIFLNKLREKLLYLFLTVRLVRVLDIHLKYKDFVSWAEKIQFDDILRLLPYLEMRNGKLGNAQIHIECVGAIDTKLPSNCNEITLKREESIALGKLNISFTIVFSIKKWEANIIKQDEFNTYWSFSASPDGEVSFFIEGIKISNIE